MKQLFLFPLMAFHFVSHFFRTRSNINTTNMIDLVNFVIKDAKIVSKT